jgi:hypothetical protein
MSELAYVCLYNSYLASLAPYTDAQVGRLVRAMMAYSQNGEIPLFKGTERMIWPTLQNQIDRDREAYEDRRRASIKNGAKGGRPKSQKKTQELIPETQETQGFISETQKTQGFFSKPRKPKEKENKKEKKNEKENENEKDKENEREIICAPGRASSPSLGMTAPTAKEVQLYCLEAALEFDPEQFVDYYTAVGWKRGGLPITDWKAAARCWASRQLPERPYDL